MVANECETFWAARQIIAVVAGDTTRSDVDVPADKESGSGILAVRIAWIPRKQMSTAIWSQSVQRVEIERRRSEVLDRGGIRFALAERGQVQRDVVIDKLTEIREPRRHLGVVAGVAAWVGVRHGFGQLCQRPIVDAKRRELGKHAAEHSRVAMPRQRLARGVTAGRAMAGPDRNRRRQSLFERR